MFAMVLSLDGLLLDLVEMSKILLFPMLSVSKRKVLKSDSMFETSYFMMHAIVGFLSNCEILPKLFFFILVNPALV